MKPLWNAFLSVSILALGALPAHAQPVISAKSGVVSYVIGKVMVGDEAVKQYQLASAGGGDQSQADAARRYLKTPYSGK